jgi:curli biogenesis system outer membrane secretion channel CsgG
VNEAYLGASEDVLIGIGTYRIGNDMAKMGTGKTFAETRARADLARQLDTMVKNMVTDYTATSEIDPDAALSLQESITQALSRAELKGARTVKMDVDGNGLLWVVMEFSKSAAAAEVNQASSAAKLAVPAAAAFDALARMDAAFSKEAGGGPVPQAEAAAPAQAARAPVSAPAPVSAQPARAAPADELAAAVREASDYLNRQLSKGNKLMILNVQSEFPALSEYIIDELIANTVNDRVFSVVDRQQLDTIRAEMEFQMSGEVDDATAQSLGRIAGAQTIVSGAVSRLGDRYRLRVRALSVQSAQIEGQFNRNIPDGPIIAALVQSQATGYGGAAAPVASGTPSARGGGTAPAQAAQPAAAAPEAPKTYRIGDTGPAGGIVFYDKGMVANGWRYMEAAPNDVGPAQWGARGTDVKGTSTTTGNGKANTQRVVSALAEREEDGAALLCSVLDINGYTDWFLPSMGELDLMYKNLKERGLGGFGNGYYWSSTQFDSNFVWVQRFGDGEQFHRLSDFGSKDAARSIRACRQF